jgi:hypothetical protein
LPWKPHKTALSGWCVVDAASVLYCTAHHPEMTVLHALQGDVWQSNERLAAGSGRRATACVRRVSGALRDTEKQSHTIPRKP